MQLLTTLPITISALFLILSCQPVAAFQRASFAKPVLSLSKNAVTTSLSSTRDDFEFSFLVPKKGIADIGTAEVKLPPLLENSELVVVRYNLPFGLSAEPSPAQNGEVVITKDGAPGKEIVGDILRQTTYWGGMDGKEVGIFDVSKNKANFDRVVAALVTNDLAVSDEIVLVFERPL